MLLLRWGSRLGVGSFLLFCFVAVLGIPPLAPSAAAAATAIWSAPLRGQLSVLRPFTAPSNPYGPGHRGVDLGANSGTPVLAAADGEVAFSGVVAGRGVVSVQTGALRTTYEPVRPAVRVGQPVRRGAVLGFLVSGHPGCAARACLHWGLRRGDVYLDPLRLLTGPGVRLLPLDGLSKAEQSFNSIAPRASGKAVPPGPPAHPARGPTGALGLSLTAGAGALVGAGLLRRR